MVFGIVLVFLVVGASGCLSWLQSGITDTADFVGLTSPEKQAEVATAIVGAAATTGNPFIMGGAGIATGLLTILGYIYRRKLLKTQPPKD